MEITWRISQTLFFKQNFKSIFPTLPDQAGVKGQHSIDYDHSLCKVRKALSENYKIPMLIIVSPISYCLSNFFLQLQQGVIMFSLTFCAVLFCGLLCFVKRVRGIITEVSSFGWWVKRFLRYCKRTCWWFLQLGKLMRFIISLFFFFFMWCL